MKYFLLQLAIVAITAVAWTTIIYGILNLFGIRMFSRWMKQEERREANQSILERLAKWQYVFIFGVISWGWGIFVAMTFSQYLMRYSGSHFHRFDWGSILLDFLAWSAGGTWVGLDGWKSLTKSYPVC